MYNKIIIIDDKKLGYQTLGKTRRDLYIALANVMKRLKWQDIKCCTVFSSPEDNTTQTETNKVEQIESIEFCWQQLDFSKLDEINNETDEDPIKLNGIELDKGNTLILLDVLLADGNAGEDFKNKSVEESFKLYKNLIQHGYCVLYYSTCADDYRNKIDQNIFEKVVEMDWYDIRSSAIEIIRQSDKQFTKLKR